MSSKRAGDVMIPLNKYPHIPYWFTLRQAIMEMQKAELDIEGKRKSLPRALLVFDEKYQLLGVVRRRDLLRGLEPKFLKTMSVPNRRSLFDLSTDDNLVDFSSGKVGAAIHEQAETPVHEVMVPITATVQDTDHLAKVIHKIVSHDQTLLPVLSGDKVIGVIRTVEVLDEVAELLL